MDRDHLRIYNLIEKFNDLTNDFNIKTTTDDIIIEICETVRSIVKFIETHFRLEEFLMEKANYPRLEEHKKGHGRIESNVSTLRNQVCGSMHGFNLVKGPDPEGLKKMRIVLLNWWVNHINTYDQEYKPYLEQKGESSKENVL